MYSLDDVTIIIPAYCATVESLSWFEECLESALAQGCKVSIASDASPKTVYGIVKEFWSPQITAYQLIEENVGVAGARNVATANAITDLIFPLDGDDTLKEGAIQELVDRYDGVPLYPDISKFGDEDVPHYALLEFTCKHLYSKVGLASVGVLHEKKQWKKVGGWNEHIDFYEDGEYNARLMLSYCGKRVPLPLLNYRIHSGQRTKRNKSREVSQARKILSMIQEHSNMACCGKNRKSRASGSGGIDYSSVQRSNTVDVNSLPGTQGDRVLALYIGGKGGAKHYYKGLGTNYPYKVKHGEYYYVDPLDAKSQSNKTSRSLFILVQRVSDSVKVEPVKEESKSIKNLIRMPRKAVKKAPIEEEKKKERPLPDINNLKWQKEIRHMDFTSDEATKLIKIEKSGKNRVRVIQHLEKSIEKG